MPVIRIQNLSTRDIVIGNPDGREQAIDLRPSRTVELDVSPGFVRKIKPALVSLEDAGKITFEILEDDDNDAPVGITPATATTTGPVELWVSTAGGNDTNPGTELSPLKTINAALDKLPPFISHNVTIWVRPGNYVEQLNRSFIVNGNDAVVMNITGTDWTDVTPTTGLATGTLASLSATNFTATVTGAGWTTNNLRGKFMLLTSGTRSGLAYPIAGNTATEIELAYATSTGLVAAATGQTFKIVSPAATITAPANDVGACRMAVLNGARVLNEISLSFNRLNFDGLNTYAVGIFKEGSAVKVTECAFLNNTARCVYSRTNSALVSIYRCYASKGNLFQGGGTKVIIVDSVSDAGTAGITLTGTTQSLGITGLLIQNTVGQGIKMQAGPVTFSVLQSSSYIRIRNVTGVGIQVLGRFISAATVFRISGCTSHGIHFDSSGEGGNASIGLANGTTITGCGGNGIRMDSPFNYVMARTADISGNTGYGIRMGVDSRGAYNFVSFTTASTLPANTGGSISLDGGATNITLAAVRAATGKTIVDATRFNKVVSD